MVANQIGGSWKCIKALVVNKTQGSFPSSMAVAVAPTRSIGKGAGPNVKGARRKKVMIGSVMKQNGMKCDFTFF